MLTTDVSSLGSHTTSDVAPDNPGLGTLAMLPREIGDEIYRYLVKGIYPVMCPSTSTTKARRMMNRPVKLRKNGPDPTTLQLSKAINHEASAVKYSESLFLCCVGFHQNLSCLPQASIDRMMNIELKVPAGIQILDEKFGNPEDRCLMYQNEKWETIIKALNSTDLVRKIVRVVFRIFSSQPVSVMPRKILHDLKTLVRYRTVVVEFLAQYYLDDESEYPKIENKHLAEGIESVVNAVIRDLEPALGPASLSHTRIPSTIRGCSHWVGYLTFHPIENLATKSETRVEEVGLKGKMNSKGLTDMIKAT